MQTQPFHWLLLGGCGHGCHSGKGPIPWWVLPPGTSCLGDDGESKAFGMATENPPTQHTTHPRLSLAQAPCPLSNPQRALACNNLAAHRQADRARTPRHGPLRQPSAAWASTAPIPPLPTSWEQSSSLLCPHLPMAAAATQHKGILPPTLLTQVSQGTPNRGQIPPPLSNTFEHFSHY